jgi:hypothetical protein
MIINRLTPMAYILLRAPDGWIHSEFRKKMLRQRRAGGIKVTWDCGLFPRLMMDYYPPFWKGTP